MNLLPRWTKERIRDRILEFGDGRTGGPHSTLFKLRNAAVAAEIMNKLYAFIEEKLSEFGLDTLLARYNSPLEAYKAFHTRYYDALNEKLGSLSREYGNRSGQIGDSDVRDDIFDCILELFRGWWAKGRVTSDAWFGSPLVAE